MIFEDAHWTESQQPSKLVRPNRGQDTNPSRAVDRHVQAPSSSRPGLGDPMLTALTINRLAEREVGAMIWMVSKNSGNKLLPANIRQDIIERTDGIPLFVE